MSDTSLILRTAENGDLPARISIGDHKPTWEVGECPSCGSAPCGPHPDFLICAEDEEDWPCSTAQAVIGELDRLATDLTHRRAERDEIGDDDYDPDEDECDDAGDCHVTAAVATYTRVISLLSHRITGLRGAR